MKKRQGVRVGPAPVPGWERGFKTRGLSVGTVLAHSVPTAISGNEQEVHMNLTLGLIALPLILLSISLSAWSKHHDELPFRETITVKAVKMKTTTPQKVAGLYKEFTYEDRGIASVKTNE